MNLRQAIGVTTKSNVSAPMAWRSKIAYCAKVSAPQPVRRRNKFGAAKYNYSGATSFSPAKKLSLDAAFWKAYQMTVSTYQAGEFPEEIVVFMLNVYSLS